MRSATTTPYKGKASRTSALSQTSSVRWADSILLESDALTEDSTMLPDQSAIDKSPDIPNVNERLAYLKPSRQLLEFYRKKFAQQDAEHTGLVEKLQTYKKAYEDQYAAEWDMRQQEEEMVELQKALSDMQLSLFQEREQVLRLYAENDRYKIKDLATKRTIKKLLDQNQEESAGTKNVFHELRPTDKTTGSYAKLNKVSTSHGYKLVIDSHTHAQDEVAAKDALAKQIGNLQSQLESQTQEAKQKITELCKEREKLASEYEYIRQKDADKVKTVTEKLHKSQDLLYLSTEDLLSQMRESADAERQWMIEKDRLLRELDSVKEQLGIEEPERGSRKVLLNITNHAQDSSQRHKKELQKLREEVANSHHMTEIYREQVISLEDNLARLREQDDLKNEDFQEKSEKVSKRYNIMKERFEDLEKRRNLEVEGFKNDAKMLRKRIKEIEHQIYKVTLGDTDSYLDETRPDDIDLDVLRNVHGTTMRSQKITNDLNKLKKKIHNLERGNDGGFVF